MTQIEEKILDASFRGVPFWVTDENTNRGNKTALHEYAHQDIRYVERLGKIPPIINLTCLIHGEDYIQNRFDFENAVEEPGVGELVHPVYGKIPAQAGPVNIVYSSTSIGKFIFKITFYPGDNTGITPTPTKESKENITKKREAITESILAKIEEDYQDPEDGFSLEKAVAGLTSVIDTVKSSINNVTSPITSVASSLNGAIDSIRDGVSVIAQTGKGVKNSLNDVYTNFVQLTNTPAELSDAYIDLVNFDSYFPDPQSDVVVHNSIGKTNTVKRTNIERNRNLLSESTRIIGYLGFAEATSDTEVEDVDGLNELSSKLDEIFDAQFVNNEENDAFPSISRDQSIRLSVLDFKVSLRKVLEDKIANAWRTTEVNVSIVPLSLLTHRYYGDLENLDTIINLNPESNNSNARDTIKMIVK